MKKINSLLKAAIIVALAFFNFIMFMPQHANAQQGTWISNGNTIVYTNRKVGVKTNSPTKDFDCNGSLRSVNAFVDSVLKVWQLMVTDALSVGQFTLSGNNIISSTGNINFGNNNLTTTGAISANEITANNGTITNTLTAGNINATDIQTQTINANEILIQGLPVQVGDTIDVKVVKAANIVIDGPAEQIYSTSGTLDFKGNNIKNIGLLTVEQIGLNVTTPIAAVQINGTDSLNSAVAITRFSNDNEPPTLALLKYRGTAGNPLPVQNNDCLGKISFHGYDGNAYKSSDLIKGIATENYSPSGHGSELFFSTTPNGSTSNQIALKLNNDQTATFYNAINTPVINATNINASESITTAGNITAKSINTTNLNVTGQTSFDSLRVTNRIKIGNSIYLGINEIGTANNIYTNDGNLLIQSEQENYYITDHNTIINANNNGRVGVGTDNPQAKIHLFEQDNATCSAKLRLEFQTNSPPNGCGTNNSTWDLDAFDDNKFIISTPSLSIPVITLTKQGNVGIGNTAPDAKFHIGNGQYTNPINFQLENDEGKLEIGIAKSAGDFAPESKPGNAVFRVSGDENSMVFNINNDDPSGYILFNSIYDNNIMKILCNGNIGIGTTTPQAKLYITGCAGCDFSQSQPALFKAHQSSNTDWAAEIYNNGGNGKGLLIIADGTTSGVPALKTQNVGGDIGLVVNSDGNVGIGTNDPKALVHIMDGDLLLENNYYLKSKRNGNTLKLIGLSGSEENNRIEIGEATTFPSEVRIYTPTDNGQGVSVNNGTDNIAFFRNDGNVGIGTTNPSASLDVKLPLNAPLATMAASFSTNNENGKVFIVPELCGWGFNAMSVGGDQGIFWSDSQAGGGNNQNAGFVIGPQKVGEAYGIRITNVGDVGIGISTPGYKLDVCGIIRAKEVIVNLTGCDFVFDENYNLIPLKVRKPIVLKQKHLFNIASAKEMQQGTLMGVTMMGILQNVEEHEQYLYQHDERIEKLEKENKELKEEIKALYLLINKK
ncbi:MAG: hypothetical protein A2X08_12505 [Bacteroidetes bacterium GWA2_32_17]|nr:MAG: hypothetical protein A2X08_12505 [Bacteroidetes bacterium GWA2_32_17]